MTSRHFEVGRMLRQVCPKLLREFFTHFSIEDRVSWDEVSTRNMGLVQSAICNLDDSTRGKVHIALEQIDKLGDERGVRVLHEELSEYEPLLLSSFADQIGRIDKSMWVYLQRPKIFESASRFALALQLAGGRSWVKFNSLPKRTPVIKPDNISQFRQQLSEFYWKREGRGKHCHVEHLVRSTGEHYFFGYLEDFPDAQPTFESGGVLVRHEVRQVFEAVFVFDPRFGTLEMYAAGGREVQAALRAIACKSLMGVQVGPSDPLKPLYRLDHLLRAGATLVTHPADLIDRVECTRVRVRRVDRPQEYIEIRINPEEHGTGLTGLRRAIEQSLNPEHWPMDRLTIVGITFKLVFTPDAPARNMSFDVNCPNTCNLKSKPDLQRMIGERCLREWGVAVA